MERGAQVGSADEAGPTLIDACWLLVSASHLAPASAEYWTAIRQIDEKLVFNCVEERYFV
jgi:hypothetical protein